ncbi:hypothetical protein [Tissierella sp.]|uniref:hypothetical protein n=1 Tax=Tissierella sp. TaxID=41274 RepID=UPI0030228CF6
MENLIKVNFRKHEVKETLEFHLDELKAILRYSPIFDLLDIDNYRFDFITNYIAFLTDSKKSKFIDFAIVHKNIDVPRCDDVPLVFSSIMKYRELEIEKGRGMDITLEDLRIAYLKSDYEFRECLMNLFVEYMSESTINFVRKIIGQDIGNLERLYNAHLEDRKAPIMNRVYEYLR